MPPAPSEPVTSYGPIRVPGVITTVSNESRGPRQVSRGPRTDQLVCQAKQAWGRRDYSGPPSTVRSPDRGPRTVDWGLWTVDWRTVDGGPGTEDCGLWTGGPRTVDCGRWE